MTTLKEALKGKLSKKELALIGRSFDTLGDIAIIEIPEQLEKKEKLIGETLLKINKQINVVCKKQGIHSGTFRTQKLKIIAGQRRKTTEYKENNVKIRLHAEKVYFSPRLSSERKRIMQQVKKDESVLIMFSGVAPYCLVIGKNTKAKEIYGIEINPEAHKFALENIKLNKLENKIKLFNGDVRLILPKINKKFDRIAMPLPKSAEDFLDTALDASKKGTIIHFYDFLKKEEFEKAKEKIKKACELKNKKYRILGVNKCGSFGPGKFRICVDFKVLN